MYLRCNNYLWVIYFEEKFEIYLSLCKKHFTFSKEYKILTYYELILRKFLLWNIKKSREQYNNINELLQSSCPRFLSIFLQIIFFLQKTNSQIACDLDFSIYILNTLSKKLTYIRSFLLLICVSKNTGFWILGIDTMYLSSNYWCCPSQKWPSFDLFRNKNVYEIDKK